MKWFHPIGDAKPLRAWLRWRERLLIDWENRIIREARDRAVTDEEREFMDELIAERARNASVATTDRAVPSEARRDSPPTRTT